MVNVMTSYFIVLNNLTRKPLTDAFTVELAEEDGGCGHDRRCDCNYVQIP
jgi:hypothetical protein